MSYIQNETVQISFIDYLGELGLTPDDVYFSPTDEKHYIMVDGNKKFIPEIYEAII